LERILTLAYVLLPVVFYFISPLLGAIGIFLWQTRGVRGWGLGLLVAGIGSFAICLAFRAWVVRWGRRRFGVPNDQGKESTTASRHQTDQSAPPGAGSDPETRQKLTFLAVMGLICLAVGIPFVTIGISYAVVDFRRIESSGVVLETRIKPRPKGRDKEGMVEYTVAGQMWREWVVIERQHSNSDVNDRGGVGETRTIWYDPHSPGNVTADRPTPWTSVKGAAFFGLFAGAGFLSELAVGINLIRRWRGRRR
jgi:hypothetical protein